MAKSYPDLTIKDDWNERTPKPVTSFGDDIKRAGNEPEVVKRSPEELKQLVETSAGAVPTDSETADAARDVAMKPADVESFGGDPDADTSVTAVRVAPKGSSDTAGTSADTDTPPARVAKATTKSS